MSRSLSMRRRSVGMHRVPGEFGIHLRTSSTPPSDIHRASDDILERSLHPTVSEQVGHDFRIDTRLQRYCEPLRHPTAPDLSLAGVRLIIADHAMGLPVLRTLSLCTCRRQYPGVAAGRNLRSTRPAISAFPDMAVGSACTSSFSRLARRSLTLRPAHSRCHQFVTR